MKIFSLAAIAAGLVVCMSCSSDKPDDTNHYLQEMTGRYWLSEIYTEEPVDINYDGAANTDMKIEMDCRAWPFGIFMAQILDISKTYKQLSYNTPVINNPEPYPVQQCFGMGSMFYSLDVNKDNGTITILNKDLVDEPTILERGSLELVRFSNDTLHLEFNRRLMTRPGFKNFRLHLIYVKDPDSR